MTSIKSNQNYSARRVSVLQNVCILGNSFEVYLLESTDTLGQAVVLNAECLNPGTIRHELMHTLGFRHEQARADRDEYVKIVWDNIAENNCKS
jgi:hypothetical protein